MASSVIRKEPRVATLILLALRAEYVETRSLSDNGGSLE